ncbi:cAMP-dependent protein kinase type II regulatory subunit [Araneus ventricosus]|uniref:cAMP-dependent protein kinase type II regulatory subunit n=1 Tax=Araneus ventricosus TaxID=182803 RepID=A0A4Y2NJ02_ARAVE|nr:cAMP-dependent protein kinase type II regulatory subunit [Araneus ventricosus]
MSERHIKVPPILEKIVMEFTINVMVENPKDIISYAADYFTRLRDNIDKESPTESFGQRTDTRNLLGYRVVGERYNAEEFDHHEKIEKFPKTVDEINRIKERIKDVVFFKALYEENINEIINAMRPREVKAGEIIFRQGDVGELFYLIEEGTFESCVEYQNSVQQIAKIFYNSGSFGELALLHDHIRDSSVIATTTGRLWTVSRNIFIKLIMKKFFYKIQKEMGLLEKVPKLQPLAEFEKVPKLQTLAESEKVPKLQTLAESEKVPKLQTLAESEKVPKLQPLAESEKVYKLQPLAESEKMLVWDVSAPVNQIISYAADYFTRLRDNIDKESPTESFGQRTDTRNLLGYRALGMQSLVGERYNTEEFDHHEKIEKFPKTVDEINRIKERIKDVVFFKALYEEDINEIIDAMRPREVKAGEIIFRQGDVGELFYLIEEGTFESCVEYQNSVQQIAKIFYNSGSFGKLALLHDHIRDSSVVATTTGRLWTLSRKNFNNLRVKRVAQLGPGEYFEGMLQLVSFRLKNLVLARH